MTETPSTEIDDYIAGFPLEVRERLTQIRTLIAETAPEASERISYRMPTFYLNGNLVHFAAFAHHIGFYPAPTAVEEFAAEIAQYKHAKGSVQFPHDRPLPLDLIRRMVRYRVEETARKRANGAGAAPSDRAVARVPRR